MKNNYAETHRQPVVYNVLPAELRYKADEALNAIRNSKFSLSTAMETAISQLLPLTKPVPASQLVDGRDYYRFYHSPFATAIRNGKTVPNHGEVYLTVSTWLKKENKFYYQTAWSNCCFENIKSGTLLIES